MGAAFSMSRRVFLGAAAAAGAGAVLWPGGGDGRRAPRGRIELRYWEKWAGPEGAAMQAVVDRYNASQERAWVRMVPVGEITPKAMVAIGGGDPPDIVGLYSYSIPGFAEARAAMPLDDFRGLGEIDWDAYVPGVRALLRHEGRPWAGVNTCYVLAMYYNRAMLREVGADPDRPPRTFPELDEIAQGGGGGGPRGGIERAGFLPNVPPWWTYLWLMLFGGRLYDPAAGRALIDAPECVRALEWAGATARRYGPAATRAFGAEFVRSIHSAQDPFISGRVAMIVQGTWLGSFINAFRPDLDYGCCPAPVAAGILDPARPAGLLEADVLVIPRGCPHPEEAYRFLLYTQRREVQEALALAHCKPSPFREASAGFLDRHPHRAIRAHDAIARSEGAMVLPRHRAWKQCDDLINAAFEAVWSGADPKAELAKAQARAQELIDTAALRRRERAGAGA